MDGMLDMVLWKSQEILIRMLISTILKLLQFQIYIRQQQQEALSALSDFSGVNIKNVNANNVMVRKSSRCCWFDCRKKKWNKYKH